MKRNIKNLFILLVSIILISALIITPTAQSISSEPNPRPLHYMGALPGSSKNSKNIEEYLLTEDTSKSVSLPSSVDNSHLYPTPVNQTQSDCVGYAVGYAHMAGIQALNRGWTVNTDAHKFSPSFVYNVSNEGVDDGIVLADAIYYAIQYGVCPITYYSINNAFDAPIPSRAFEAASLYKPTSYSITRNLTKIKQFIAEGKGVVIDIFVYDDMYYDMSSSNYIYDEDYGTNHGGHAICLVGYDDAEQAFKFINSWGPAWCQNGFGWISYDFVASDDINMSSACHGYVLNFPENNDYVMGDVNFDNTLTAADGRLALRFSAGEETPTDRQYVLSDVDGDGTVTEADARNILGYVANTIDKLPLYE